MATWYSRTWKSGKVSWYTKIKDARGQWQPVLLKGVTSEGAAKKLALEMEKARERSGHGLPAASPFVGTFADLCAWANQIHFSKGAGAQPDAARLKAHAGDPANKTATWLGALPLQQVTGPKLATYFSELTESLSARGKPYSNGTINRIRAQFASVFELAREHGKWFGDNPVHATKERPVVKAGFDILQAAEVKPTLDHTDDYWRGCLATGILAALRKGELFGLMKKDVDLARRVLLVRRSHERETTKGGTHKPVPIHEDLVPYITPWLETPGPWLFPDHDGKRRSRHTDLPGIVQRAMARAGFIERWTYACRRKGCGYRDERPHAPTEPVKRECPVCAFRLQPTPHARAIRWHEATRHTLASHALMSGAGVASVQAILRHADPRLTIQTYGHLSPNFLGDEVNRVSLPGLGKAGDTEQSGDKTGQNVEPELALTHTDSEAHGAWVVRSAPRRSRAGGEELTIQHDLRGESEWSRGVSNPGPMHCESNGVQLQGTPPRVTVSQVGVFPHSCQETDSAPSPSVAPRSTGHGAWVVRKRALTHHDQKTAKGLGSGRTTEHDFEDLLTVQQVADRLTVGRMWVRKRLASGDLTGVRVAHQAPLLISARELEAYLARFPGITPEPPRPASRKPEYSEQAPARRSRKGAA